MRRRTESRARPASSAGKTGIGPAGRRFTAALALLWTLVSGAAQGALQRPSSFERLAGQAAKASQENRLEDAAGLYRRALALRPSWKEGWWSLGTLEYDRSRYREAAGAFERLLALEPGHGTAHAMLGLCQVELRQDEAALRNLTLAQRQGVQNDQQLRRVVLYQLSGVQLRKRRFGDAKTTLELLVTEGAQSEEVTRGLGMAALLIEPRNLPAAGAPGREVVERAGRAESQATLKEFDAGKQAFTLLVSEYPTYPNLRYAFGRFLLEAHEPDEAVAEFQKELENDPRHVGSLLEIAAVRYRTASADGVQYAEKAVNIKPDNPFAHYLLGLLYLDTGKAEAALPQLELARKAFAGEAQIYFALGNAYARVGRNAEAARMRAEFTRLKGRKGGESGASVYGDEPSGTAREKLREESQPAPKKP